MWEMLPKHGYYTFKNSGELMPNTSPGDKLNTNGASNQVDFNTSRNSCWTVGAYCQLTCQIIVLSLSPENWSIDANRPPPRSWGFGWMISIHYQPHRGSSKNRLKNNDHKFTSTLRSKEFVMTLSFKYIPLGFSPNSIFSLISKSNHGKIIWLRSTYCNDTHTICKRECLEGHTFINLSWLHSPLFISLVWVHVVSTSHPLHPLLSSSSSYSSFRPKRELLQSKIFFESSVEASSSRPCFFRWLSMSLEFYFLFTRVLTSLTL